MKAPFDGSPKRKQPSPTGSEAKTAGTECRKKEKTTCKTKIRNDNELKPK